MIRVICTLGCVLFTASPSLGNLIYRLEGQVTEGLALFPPAVPDPNAPYDQYGAPASGFPVDFLAQLTLGPQADPWTFQFTVFDGSRAETFQVNEPNLAAFEPAPFVNNVEQTGGRISIEFQDTPIAFEQFALNIDVAVQTGTWHWRRDCPVCDLLFPLPSASAIVSAIQAIPEPQSAVLASLAMCAAFWHRRRGEDRTQRHRS